MITDIEMKTRSDRPYGHGVSYYHPDREGEPLRRYVFTWNSSSHYSQLNYPNGKIHLYVVDMYKDHYYGEPPSDLMDIVRKDLGYYQAAYYGIKILVDKEGPILSRQEWEEAVANPIPRIMEMML